MHVRAYCVSFIWLGNRVVLGLGDPYKSTSLYHFIYCVSFLRPLTSAYHSVFIYFYFFSLIGSQLPELQGMWGTIFAVASRVCAAGAYYACLQFASELFPTEIRGKGSSAFEISGGLGLFIQPQINYLVRICHVLLQ